MEKLIRFNGAEFLLIGDLKIGGAIATIDQYEGGKCSFAHLMPSGNVMRFREVIGNRSDIEVIGELQAEIRSSPLGMLTDPSWLG